MNLHMINIVECQPYLCLRGGGGGCGDTCTWFIFTWIIMTNHVSSLWKKRHLVSSRGQIKLIEVFWSNYLTLFSNGFQKLLPNMMCFGAWFNEINELMRLFVKISLLNSVGIKIEFGWHKIKHARVWLKRECV